MKHLFFILLWFPSIVFSQVMDDFSDGNFTENPTWTGDQNKFIVNDQYQLQLVDVDAGTAQLSTGNSYSGDTEWRLFVRLAFSPSSNNFARFYLMSNQSDLQLPLQGYYLQLGESGGNDALELFKQDGTTSVSVCRGTEGLISSSFAIAIKITKTIDGDWKILADPQGGDSYQLEAEGIDNSFSQSSALGFVCTYTVSNSDNFYFDNVYVGQVIVDNTPPNWLSITVTSDSTLLLEFDESLNADIVSDISHYQVNNSIGNPVSAGLQTDDPKKIQLFFEQKFVSGQVNEITVSGLKDLADNVMVASSMEFVFYMANSGDVVINEIMADPNPVVGLPDFEYLELHNLTNNTIDVNGWTLTIGTSEKVFEGGSIPGKGYLIVAKESAQNELSSYGLFYGFSSFSLTNAGQLVVLVNKEGEEINRVEYTDNWYQDPDKSDGGWSLEQMNPNNVCSGEENWCASVSSSGGTPGTQNSVYNDQVLFPAVDKLIILANNILQITFNQTMDAGQLQVNANYQVNHEVGNPQYTYLVVDDWRKIELYFEESFTPSVLYELTVSRNLLNCNGLAMAHDTVISFGLPEEISDNDIIINELLFNPWADGVDYVELYNRSNKVLDLSELLLGTIKKSPPNPPDTGFYSVTEDQQLMVPGEYMVLTVSPEVVKKQYYTQNSEAFLRVDPFPAYNNDSGWVLLQTKENLLIDELFYSEDMQFPLLNYVDGVALERIQPDMPTSDPNNWHSAAESVGFGTPGYLNSQEVNHSISDENIQLTPEIFSPDNDGYNDVINVEYSFDEPGYMMQVSIFNASGYKVRTLVNNQYLGTSGMVSWDGITDSNTKAPVGIYVFFVEVFDLEGNVKKYKKTGVLATQL